MNDETQEEAGAKTKHMLADACVTSLESLLQGVLTAHYHQERGLHAVRAKLQTYEQSMEDAFRTIASTITASGPPPQSSLDEDLGIGGDLETRGESDDNDVPEVKQKETSDVDSQIDKQHVSQLAHSSSKLATLIPETLQNPRTKPPLSTPDRPPRQGLNSDTSQIGLQWVSDSCPMGSKSYTTPVSGPGLALP